MALGSPCLFTLTHLQYLLPLLHSKLLLSGPRFRLLLGISINDDGETEVYVKEAFNIVNFWVAELVKLIKYLICVSKLHKNILQGGRGQNKNPAGVEEYKL